MGRVGPGPGSVRVARFAGFGSFVAMDGLVVTGDAARTAQDIADSEGLFRVAVASLRSAGGGEGFGG
ncbi:hypothetical protein EV646_106389 [Kribbella antiqua]|uniref:Uncharacterized protein n=1 Tax=Kribbella antiqua TaxID=2512217 RepID=A0A4R2ISK3_9ACTN|nr:hypothetical protein EV646_106389 [Kribbella antiqua]